MPDIIKTVSKEDIEAFKGNILYESRYQKNLKTCTKERLIEMLQLKKVSEIRIIKSQKGDWIIQP